ncbi:MAG TPA: zinc dependent phospholipase C family protein [Candidatus Ozemobacteraceae bacterium]|nr:zinc dependent phospholipase C family protein [Candidatus Ozemobacteraceae bacterium]
MKTPRAAVFLLGFLALSGSVQAWGPLTHVQIALDAMNKASETIPPEYMGAFLAGCTEPDIGAGQGSAGLDNGVSENYLLYHDSVFVDAMVAVAKRKGGKEGSRLLARAQGLQAHILADSVAHTDSGYPNSKQFYNTISLSQDYMPNHIGNEFCLDLLAYNQAGTTLSGNSFDFIDAETLSEVRTEYAKLKKIDLPSDTSELEKQISNHQLTIQSEMAVGKDLKNSNPKRLEEIDTFFSDRNKGIHGSGGLDQAIEKVASVRFGELSKEAQTESGLQEKVVGGFQGLVSDLAKSGANSAVETGEDFVILLNNQKIVSGAIQSTVNDKVASRNNRLIGNLALNILRKDDASFSEVILNTERTVQGDSWNDEEKLKTLRIEEKLLEEKEAKAKLAWENRPWWNVWLLITNADQNTYLTLKAQHDLVQDEIKRLSASEGSASGQNPSAPSSVSPATVSVSDGTQTSASGSSTSLNSFLNQ